jgi:hypothetical protein
LLVDVTSVVLSDFSLTGVVEELMISNDNKKEKCSYSLILIALCGAITRFYQT